MADYFSCVPLCAGVVCPHDDSSRIYTVVNLKWTVSYEQRIYLSF